MGWMSLGSFSAPENEHKKVLFLFKKERKKIFSKFFSVIKNFFVPLHGQKFNSVGNPPF
jgi:hypothetical protein